MSPHTYKNYPRYNFENHSKLSKKKNSSIEARHTYVAKHKCETTRLMVQFVFGMRHGPILTR